MCSILPYKISYKGMDAVILPNKCIQLISIGLPIISTNLKNIYKCDFIEIFHLDNFSYVIDLLIHKRENHLYIEPINNFINLSNENYKKFISELL